VSGRTVCPWPHRHVVCHRRAYGANVAGSRSFESIDESAALLAVVADPIRLEVVQRLVRDGTRCVCDLQTDPPIPGNQLSYHLRVLRDSGLVSATRRGRWVDYTLADDALERLRAALPHPISRA
jgi:ArsR family transcriptional regulator, arsenate/arsenite/antimonite-responsive transcriptional repressor